MANVSVNNFPADLGHAIFENTPPHSLYHYTSFASGLAILDSKAMWATHCRALNDEKEVRHAVHVLTHAVENYVRQSGFKDESTVKAISRHFQSSGEKLLGHCICSFSESEDILSQWRAYGSDGQGLAIGFNAKLLQRDALASGFKLGRCIYDSKLQYKLCFEFVASLLKDTDVLTLIKDFPEPLALSVETFIYTVGLFLKHPAFIDEREWRLVSGENHLYSPNWKFRATARGLTSYVIVQLPSIFERESDDEEMQFRPHFKFTLGPKAKVMPTVQILQAISQRLLGCGYGVQLSDVPYVD